MKLQVTEVSKSFLDGSEEKIENEFSFINSQISGSLAFGTVFQAQMQEDRSIEVYLVRKTDENNYEVYNHKTLFASNSIDFEDTSSSSEVSITFKLIK